LNLAAIIPVKNISRAKSRLSIPQDKKELLCILMLSEVLKTLQVSPRISETIIVSQDCRAKQAAKEFGAIFLYDEREDGVNGAISIADRYLRNTEFEASLILPQDIPFIMPQDIDFLLSFATPPKFALVVPSRRFDGTNALARMPADLMPTHYDEDSYRIHMQAGREKTASTSLVLIRRIMMDIDDASDLKFALARNEKPDVTQKILKILK